MEYKNIRNKNENCEVYNTTNMEIREALFRFDALHGIALMAELKSSFLKRDLEGAGITPVILELDSEQHDKVLERWGVKLQDRKCGFLYLSAPADSVTEDMFEHMTRSTDFLRWVSFVVRPSVEA